MARHGRVECASVRVCVGRKRPGGPTSVGPTSVARTRALSLV